MKILDGSRVVGDEIEIHLTHTEAAHAIDELASLLSDLTWMTEAEGWLSSDAKVIQARIYVYRTPEALEAEVDDRVRDRP